MTTDAWAPPEPPKPPPPSEEGPDLGLLLDVWLSPRIATRVVLDHGGTYLVIPLMLASGLSGFSFDPNEEIPMAGVMVGAAVVGGPVVALVAGAVQAAICSFAARLFGEEVTFAEMFAALAWGAAPAAIGRVLTAPFGAVITLGLLSGAPTPVAGGAFALSMIAGLAGLWSVFTTVGAVAEAMRTSIGRALLVLLAPGLVAAGLALLLILVLTLVGASLA